MPILVNFDSDVSAAGDPDPRGIDSAIMEQLKVGVPPARVEITAQVVPMMPRGVGSVYPDPTAPDHELSVRNRDPFVRISGNGPGRGNGMPAEY
jgi:hypothetical protein